MKSIFPKDFITTQEWSMEALESVQTLAERMTLERQAGYYHDHLLRAKTLWSVFYNSSTRTCANFIATALVDQTIYVIQTKTKDFCRLCTYHSKPNNIKT